MSIEPKELRERAIKDAKCALILDAARKLFAKNGYWETRLEDIAAAAGFSKASLYNYYIDKEAIFLSIVIDENAKIIKQIEAIGLQEGSFAQRLESILRIVFKVIRDDVGIMVNAANFQNMVTMHANMFKHKELLSQFILSANHFFSVLKENISSARKSGEITSALSDESLARFIGTFIKSMIFDLSLSQGKLDSERTIDQMLNFLSRGAGVRRISKTA